jgi:hypothetical protein
MCGTNYSGGLRGIREVDRTAACELHDSVLICHIPALSLLGQLSKTRTNAESQFSSRPAEAPHCQRGLSRNAFLTAVLLGECEAAARRKLAVGTALEANLA